MKYNDELIANADIMSVMNKEYNMPTPSESIKIQAELEEMGEYRQMAEMEDVFRLLDYCEEFLKWLEGKDDNFFALKKLLENTHNDKILAQNCCGRYGLDYRYACDGDFKKECSNYCKCEMEIIEKVIKLLSLKHSIIDKQCMIKLIQSRMDALKLIFHNYVK